MLGLVLALAILGLVLYLIETYVPMDPIIKTIIRVVIVIAVIVYLANMFGVMDLPVPRGSK